MSRVEMKRRGGEQQLRGAPCRKSKDLTAASQRNWMYSTSDRNATHLLSACIPSSPTHILLGFRFPQLPLSSATEEAPYPEGFTRLPFKTTSKPLHTPLRILPEFNRNARPNAGRRKKVRSELETSLSLLPFTRRSSHPAQPLNCSILCLLLSTSLCSDSACPLQVRSFV